MSEIDLMTDIGFDGGEPVELVIHIIKQNGHFGVVVDGRKADCLVWDEMLGQIAELTHPKLEAARYAMLTRSEIEEKRRQHDAIIESKEQRS